MSVSRHFPGRRVFAWLALSLSLALVACAAPQSGAAGPTPVATTDSRSASPAQPTAGATATEVVSQPAASAPTPRHKPAPRMSDPLPPERMPDDTPQPRNVVPRLDVSCKADADCTVKNVGNCCGIQPRCVNVNAVVDPKAVQAQCARSGLASVCGFKSVEACECRLGECHDKPMMSDAQ